MKKLVTSKNTINFSEGHGGITTSPKKKEDLLSWAIDGAVYDRNSIHMHGGALICSSDMKVYPRRNMERR